MGASQALSQGEVHGKGSYISPLDRATEIKEALELEALKSSLSGFDGE